MIEKQIIEPFKAQEKFIAAVFSGKYDTIIYGGAMGGGKTFACCIILILLCRKYPNSKWIVMRRSMPDIKRTILETFLKIYPYKWFKKVADPSDIVYEGRNGSRIIFMSENYDTDKDLNRFKSLECNGFVFEQIEEIQEKSFEMAHIRAGRWRIEPQPPKLIIGTVNPAHNWVKTRFYEASIRNELPAKTAYIPAKIADNPILLGDADYMAGFDYMDSLSRARYLDGDWNANPAQNPWAYDFNEKKHLASGLNIDRSGEIHISFDFNINPITALIIQSGKDYIHVIEEVRIENSKIHQLGKRIAEKIFIADERIPAIKITGDFSGANRTTLGNNYEELRKEFNEHLTRLGVPFQYSDKNWNRHILRLTKNPFHENSQTHVNTMLYRFPEFLIDREKCPYLVLDMKMVESTADGKIDKGDRSNPKKQADLLDCLRYYLHNFYPTWYRKMR